MIIFNSKPKKLELNYNEKNLIKDFKILSPTSFLSNQFYKIGDKIIINEKECYIKNATYYDDKFEYEICFKLSDINVNNEIDNNYSFDYIETIIDNAYKIDGKLFTSLFVLEPINFSTDNILETTTDDAGNIYMKFQEDLNNYFIFNYDEKIINSDNSVTYKNPKLETLKFNDYFFKSYTELDFTCPFKFETKIYLSWVYKNENELYKLF